MSQQSFEFDDGVDDIAAAALDTAAAADTMSIAEAIRAVNDALSAGLGGLVWVRGELHNAKVSKGHRYFDLVDDAAGNADVRQRPKVSAQLFAQAYQRIQPRLERAGVQLAEGLCVRMRGAFEVYPQTGRLNFRVVDIDPEFTVGNLAVQRDRLMQALAAEGLLTANSQLPMPLVPLRVGVVTSAGSDGWHDFRTNLGESGIGFRVELAHTLVQGAGAPIQVARAVRRLAAGDGLDVIAVVRGGGSKSDLATFDHEFVARAIAASPVPVITGIGHDSDRSVADEVAHAACKTPTACAQLLIDRVRAFQGELDRRAAELAHRVGHRRAACDRAVAERAGVLLRLARRAVGDADRGLGGRQRELGSSTSRTLRAATAQLVAHRARLQAVAPRAIGHAASDVDLLAARVDTFDPRLALARGWSITTTVGGRLVRSISEVVGGDELTTRVRGGRLRSTVTDVQRDDRG